MIQKAHTSVQLYKFSYKFDIAAEFIIANFQEFINLFGKGMSGKVKMPSHQQAFSNRSHLTKNVHKNNLFYKTT